MQEKLMVCTNAEIFNIPCFSKKVKFLSTITSAKFTQEEGSTAYTHTHASLINESSAA